jgi:hypothetical protein
VYQGYTVLVCRRDGTFQGHEREGLFDFDTRILSVYRLLLDGHEPDYVSSGFLASNHWEAKLRFARADGDPRGPALPQEADELCLQRRVGRGMEEQLVLHNHSMVLLDTVLELELDADFADVQEPVAQGNRTATCLGDIDL